MCENFLHKIRDILKKCPEGNKVDIASLNFNKIFKTPLYEYKITRKIFYVAKLHFHPETKEKSEKLLKSQRKLKNTLYCLRKKWNGIGAESESNLIIGIYTSVRLKVNYRIIRRRQNPSVGTLPVK